MTTVRRLSGALQHHCFCMFTYLQEARVPGYAPAHREASLRIPSSLLRIKHEVLRASLTSDSMEVVPTCTSSCQTLLLCSCVPTNSLLIVAATFTHVVAFALDCITSFKCNVDPRMQAEAARHV